jgi:ORF6N domain
MPVKNARDARQRGAKRRSTTVAAARVLCAILRIRGLKVMLDASLAEMYGVETRVLVQAVKRNRARFPADFMFRLNASEAASLTSQIVISNSRGGRRSLPYAFTEQGVAMLSSVLRSARAIEVNIEIMRAFVRVRAVAAGRADLVRRLDEMEKRYDHQFGEVFGAIRALVTSDPRPRRRIGFVRSPDEGPG